DLQAAPEGDEPEVFGAGCAIHAIQEGRDVQQLGAVLGEIELQHGGTINRQRQAIGHNAPSYSLPTRRRTAPAATDSATGAAHWPPREPDRAPPRSPGTSGHRRCDLRVP